MAGHEVALVNIGQLVTLKGPNRARYGSELCSVEVIENGSLLIREGLIASVGTRDEVLSQADRLVEMIDIGGRTVTPGLVDAHTHLVFGGNRVAEFSMRVSGSSYEEIAHAGGGILSTVASTRAATEEDLFSAGKTHLNWMVSCGTTTAEVKSGYGLNFETEMKMLRVVRRLSEETQVQLQPTFLGAHTVPAEHRNSRATYLREICDRMIPAVNEEGLADNCDVFCETIGFSHDETREIAGIAIKHGLKLRFHVDQLSDSGGAALASELGCVTADHLEFTGAEGIRAMAANGVIPVLLPASVYCLGKSVYPNARSMIEAGLAVVLATDFNPGSSPTPSLPFVMSLAATQMGMSPAESLVACTINAAASLGLASEIGSLEVGKKANFVVWNVSDYREILYWASAPLVHESWIDGKPFLLA